MRSILDPNLRCPPKCLALPLIAIRFHLGWSCISRQMKREKSGRPEDKPCKSARVFTGLERSLQYHCWGCNQERPLRTQRTVEELANLGIR